MTLMEYFQAPEAKRYLLVEIQRSDAALTKYYLSSEPYTTEPGDTPDNLMYTPVIGGTGLGDIRRALNDPFAGNASTGFGTLSLTDDMVTTQTTSGFMDSVIYLPRGAVVSAFLAGPAKLFNRSTAMPLFTGTVARTGGTDEGTITVEVTDGSEVVRSKTIEVLDKPIAYGRVRNIRPKLTNPALLEYYVHDGPIQAVNAVYDQGALLTAGTQYTADLATGKLTLLVSPAGELTVDVDGAKVSGTWLQSTAQVVGNLLSRAGLSITQDVVLPSGVIGLYLDQTQNLGSLLDRLLVGLAGYWLIGSNYTFVARQFPVPLEVPAEATFTDAELIGGFTYQDDDRLYKRVNFSYQVNWTQYQSRGAATAAQAEFSQLQYRQGSVLDPSPVAELQYLDSPQIDTLLDNLGDAQAVANRVLSIYRLPRKRISAEVPYSESLALGDSIAIVSGDLSFTGAIVSIADVFDGGYPIQKLEVLA